ncbi:hypothetical protein M514_03788 [Trichuris suis]|uniref:Uncharacterized protein n=1 Tax=Trichuris suis TaxID=68888 RepID=A0A085ME02_9BILA|nr:hypothetical protein M513_03788 [Trichuris suis]KFD62678.1 hypothetical protein M514_03788 [Trichuris suis]KHJ46856.1 hypothetical protein D918_03230 [Trichuris suis]
MVVLCSIEAKMELFCRSRSAYRWRRLARPSELSSGQLPNSYPLQELLHSKSLSQAESRARKLLDDMSLRIFTLKIPRTV